MYKLVLESSTKLLYVGLVKDNNLIAKKQRIAKKDHAYYISYFVNLLFKENNITPNMVGEVIVGMGPGSYTGVRVAGTFAKVFAYSLNICLKSISSLFLLTSGYKLPHISLYNAKNGRYYLGGYNLDNNILPERVYTIDEITEKKLLDNIITIDLTDDEKLLENVKIDYEIVLKMAKVENYFSYEPNYSYTNYDKSHKA